MLWENPLSNSLSAGLSVRLNMSSRTSSFANWKFSSTFPHNWINCAGKAFSYLQFHDSFSSFHAADLVHNQFHSNIYAGNILFDLLTRISARETSLDILPLLLGCPRFCALSILIWILGKFSQLMKIIFWPSSHHVTVMLVCGRSEGKFPVKISVKE